MRPLIRSAGAPGVPVGLSSWVWLQPSIFCVLFGGTFFVSSGNSAPLVVVDFCEHGYPFHADRASLRVPSLPVFTQACRLVHVGSWVFGSRHVGSTPCFATPSALLFLRLRFPFIGWVVRLGLLLASRSLPVQVSVPGYHPPLSLSTSGLALLSVLSVAAFL